MKELFYFDKCPKCKSLIQEKFSNFTQYIDKLKDYETISYSRKCIKCGAILQYNFKYTLFVKEIKNENAGVLSGEARSKNASYANIKKEERKRENKEILDKISQSRKNRGLNG